MHVNLELNLNSKKMKYALKLFLGFWKDCLKRGVLIEEAHGVKLINFEGNHEILPEYALDEMLGD